MNDESMLVLRDHDHFRSERSEVMNVIVFIWRVIGRKTGAHFS